MNASPGLRWAIGVPTLTLALLVLLPLIALVLGTSPADVGRELSDGETLKAIGTSVGCAALSVMLGLVLGVPAGHWLAHNDTRLPRLVSALLDLPLVVPHPIVGVGLLLVFGRQHLLGAALEDGLGIAVVSAAPGIVLAMTFVSAPFIVKGARDGFSAVPEDLERAARSLGASDLVTAWTVSLPLAAPHIRSGALLAWARAISEFGSIVILAYYPLTAPVLIWDRFSAGGLRAALAPAVLLPAVCMVIFLALIALSPARATARR